jgi:spermidine synthase
VLLGIAISLALTRSSMRIGLVYGVDLMGAALGCLVALALLTTLDTYTAILVVGAIGALAALAFSRAIRSSGDAPAHGALRHLPGLIVRPEFAFAALTLVAAANLLLGTHGLRPVVVKSRLEAAYYFTEERWNSFSRIAMTMRPHEDAFLWSGSDTAPHVQLDQGWMNIDGEAATAMYRFNGDPAELGFLRFDATALAYFARHQGRAAIIGMGGGRDVLTASIFGFKDITAVEYNPIFVRLFAQDYRAFSGAGRIPGLRINVDDARSWFARSHEQFDLVQMSLIDTWAATGAGAFTLSENGLYTVNGWKRFLSRLTPTGVFTVSRWYTAAHVDETARILSLAMATLMEMGEPSPAAHLYLAANRQLSTLIVGRAPLSASDVRSLDAAVRAMHYQTLAAPDRPSADAVFDRILRARTVDELVRIGRSTPLNLGPTWDSSPFFFNQLRLSDPASMLRALRSAPGVMAGNLAASLTLLTLVVVSALVVLVVIIAPAMTSARQASGRTLRWGSAYFLMIGTAFMFVEISLIQRMSLYLGHPIYGLAIVLFSVILATGIGALLSESVVSLSATSLIGWPLLLASYLALLPSWLGRLLELTEPGALIERAAVCLLAVVPAGILMGFMFPTGMRLLNRIDSRVTPWLWAVNGAAGVLSSGCAVLVSIETSLNYSLWTGAVVYAVLAGVAVELNALGRDFPERASPQAA